MKKVVISVLVLTNSIFMMAQTEFDAFKMVQTDINGSARYMSMGGAFGALGGDPSAIKDNPAGLGIYRKSEITGTANMLMQNSSGTWNGVSASSDLYNVGLNNLSLVIAAPTWRSDNGTSGLLSSNFSFAYNRLKDFNRSLYLNSGNSASSLTDYMGYFTGNLTSADLKYVPNSYDPFNNTNVPWISIMGYGGGLMNETVTNGVSSWNSFLGNTETVKPSYKLYEKGYQDEYSFGWAGNFSNIVYLGATLNLQTINYAAFSEYNENFGAGGGLNLRDSIYSNGTGVNLNIGAIVCPTDYLRVGFAFHTPTVYSMNDNYYAKLSFDNGTNTGYVGTPGGTSGYQLQSPLMLNASLAYIVGQKGLISAEYDYINYPGTRFRDQNGDAQNFLDENQGMSSVMNTGNIFKLGGEYRLTDNFSLRAGYAYANNGNLSTAKKWMRVNTVRTDPQYLINNNTNYISAGIGYHETNWSLDFAYVNKILNDTFYPYKSDGISVPLVNPANVSTTNNNLVLTLAFRF